MVQLNIGDIVTHRNFGDGKIDQQRERDGETLLHVNFAKVSAWFLPRDLKRIEPDAAEDTAAVRGAERAAYWGA